MNLFRDVGDFHRKFLLPMEGDGAEPELLADDVYNFRLKFMQEELDEFATAHAAGDLAKASDALVDLVYVALGTAHMMHTPFNECWAAVQAANMAKERAVGSDDPRSVRGHSLDVVKPAGWTPPDLDSIISLTKWDVRIMHMAYMVARWSKDPTTKVGAVVVGRDTRHMAIGYNGFPRGVKDTPERLNNRELKHRLTIHAEMNAMDHAKFDLRSSSIYSTQVPCSQCAKSIIQRGVSRIVCVSPTHEPWIADWEESRAILEEAGIFIKEIARGQEAQTG